MSDRMRQFMGPRLEAAGLDLSKPIPLDRLSSAMQRARDGQPPEENNGGSSTAAASSRLVPGFGVSSELTLVPGFDSGLGGSGPIEDRYDARIVERVQFTLRRYDSNQDGILDNAEIQRGRWSNPSWEESDTNGDGRLTSDELAERYKNREESGGDQGGGGDRGRGGPPGGGWQGGPPGGGWQGGSPGGPQGGPGGNPWEGRGRGEEAPRGESNGDSERSSDRGEERREERSSSSRSSSSRDNDSTPQLDEGALRERYTRYVTSIIGSRDEDKNGTLSMEEASRVAREEELKAADADGDEELSQDELVNFFVKRAIGETGGSGGSTMTRSRPTRSSVRNVYTRTGAVEKLESNGVSDSFIEQDTNRDGQIQMSEYARTWSQRVYDQFQEMDQNHDGVLSPSEFRSR